MPFRLNDPELALFNSIGAMSGDPDPGSERDAAITLDAFQGILARGSESRATGGVSPFKRSLRAIPTRANRPIPALRGQDESQPNQKVIEIVKSEAQSRLDERFDITGKIDKTLGISEKLEAIGEKTGISKAARKVDTSIDRLLGINPNAPGAPAPVQGGVGANAPAASAPTPGVVAPSASSGVAGGASVAPAAGAGAGGVVAPAVAAPTAGVATAAGAAGVTAGAAGGGAAAGAGVGAAGAAAGGATGAGAAGAAAGAAGGTGAASGISAALAFI